MKLQKIVSTNRIARGIKKMKKLFVSLLALVLLVLSVGGMQSKAATSNQWLIINKSTNKLAFFENGKLVKEFNVATGRSPSYTPEGTFNIVNKIKNRPYYSKNIPGGSPKNPLGDRWFGIEARGTYGNTYGIHGTNNESSIGKYASSGCVRMHNKDVRWLFERVKVPTKVTIGYFKAQSFEDISKKSGYAVASSCKGVCYDGKPVKKGQVGFVTLKQNAALKQVGKDGKVVVVKTLGKSGVFGLYKVDRTSNPTKLFISGTAYVEYSPNQVAVQYIPGSILAKVK